MKLYQPVTERMQLDMRMNLKTKKVVWQMQLACLVWPLICASRLATMQPCTVCYASSLRDLNDLNAWAGNLWCPAAGRNQVNEGDARRRQPPEGSGLRASLHPRSVHYATIPVQDLVFCRRRSDFHAGNAAQVSRCWMP